MKRILIIPATAALLTGLSANAQDFNSNTDAVKTPAPVISADEQSNLDEMTIEELNALQLQRLQSVSSETASADDTLFQVAETDTSTMAMTTQTETQAEARIDMDGPGDASEVDAMSNSDSSGTIADVAMGDPRFSTLVTLLEQADIADTLSGDGPYTVFAPTNDAFARLDPELVAQLTSGEANDDLATLLKRHVVAGTYTAADITEGTTDLMTLADTNLEIERVGDMVTADHVDVISADIAASNGVIHAIDMVIIPMVEVEAATDRDTPM
tara:strand:- start:7217 stop:8029 length:813 start_codon:yes stop_codon:yes gene_type:complete